MTALVDLLSGEFAGRCAWALIHFVWQGALLAGTLKLLSSRMKSASPQRRYILSLTTMALMVVCPLVTLCVPAQIVVIQANESVLAAVREHAYLLLAVWAAGVAVLSARLLGGWWLVNSLRLNATEAPSGDCRSVFGEVARSLGLVNRVGFLVSSRIDSPVVIGWIRPVVLFPVSLLTRLPAEQLRALIAHELAHIRRHDYLVNLLQTVAETLLFYHPCLWWVSHRIRVEREECADSDAAGSLDDASDLAEALVALEAHRAEPALAPSASGGQLMRRIRMLLEPSHAEQSSRAALGILVLVTLFTIATLPLAGPTEGSVQPSAGAALELSKLSAYEWGAMAGTMLSWLIGLALLLDVAKAVKRVRSCAVYVLAYG